MPATATIEVYEPSLGRRVRVEFGPSGWKSADSDATAQWVAQVWERFDEAVTVSFVGRVNSFVEFLSGGAEAKLIEADNGAGNPPLPPGVVL